MDKMPDSPIGEFAAGAIQIHEAYVAYINAGFTAEQAMQIILTIVAAGASRNGEQR